MSLRRVVTQVSVVETEAVVRPGVRAASSRPIRPRIGEGPQVPSRTQCRGRTSVRLDGPSAWRAR